MTDYPLIVVEWVDSCGLKGGHWGSTEDAKQLTPSDCRSVGWLINETDDAIVLAAHVTPHHVSGEMCIPKVAVTKRWPIKITKKGRRR